MNVICAPLREQYLADVLQGVDDGDNVMANEGNGDGTASAINEEAVDNTTNEPDADAMLDALTPKSAAKAAATEKKEDDHFSDDDELLSDDEPSTTLQLEGDDDEDDEGDAFFKERNIKVLSLKNMLIFAFLRGFLKCNYLKMLKMSRFPENA